MASYVDFERTIPASKRAIVYCAVNRLTLADDKPAVYVGVTERQLPERRYRHEWNAKNGSPQRFHRALVKYGFDAFNWHILDVQPNFWRGLDAEQQFIADFRKSYDLYNLTEGGGGVKGLKFSDTSRAKMADAAKRRGAPWRAGECPPEVRAKLSASAKARKGEKRTGRALAVSRRASRAANEARRRRVIRIADGFEFRSVTDAAKAHGVTTGGMTYACRSGKKFKYAVPK